VKRTIFESDHEDFRASVREFVDRQVRPYTDDFVRDKGWPRGLWIEAGKQGFLGLEVPEEYGGSAAGDYRFNAVLGEELGKVGVALSSCFGIHFDIVAPYLVDLTTQEQKQRWLPGFCSGEIVTAIGMTEPSGGSDLAALRTTAVRDGDDWVVNGQKTWTTLGQYADWIFCLCRTDPTAEKKQRGISLLVFPMDSPGVTLRPIELLDGGFEVNEVFFEDVRVPAENLVGEENRGWDYAKFLLGNERVGIARVGATKRMLAQAKEHAAQITSGGRPLAEDPRMAARIAEIENELLALELTALRVVATSADGKPHPASSVLKLRGSELQQAATELMVDLAGPLSVASFAEEGSDVPDWARAATPHYLNYRKVSIYGGSNEVQRTIIAGSILGL
jgi:alkylation response protein AidB-like acyl-CoA dehydrogenase